MGSSMLEAESQKALHDEIARQITEDQTLLTELRKEIKPLISKTRRISPHSTTSISVVAGRF